MACDGEIDQREISLIKTMHETEKIFGDINISEELDNLLTEMNLNSKRFIKDFFHEVGQNELSEKDQLRLIEVAIDTIKADDKIEYSEVKFFKVIRSHLKIDNESILAIHPDFEDYLEEDIISKSYLTRLQEDYFSVQDIPEFQSLGSINGNIVENKASDGSGKSE